MYLVHLWYQLRRSFWFIPSLITVGAAVASQISLELDEALPWQEYKSLKWIYSGSGEGAATLLSAIVGSMITATSITFSMTLVALTLTASQYGPRLLQNFMRRPGSQIVLGTFLATFIFSLLVLRSVQITDEAAVIPHLSVTVAVGLALASVGVLIFFIHHIATAIQADTIISHVYNDLVASIDRIFPEQIRTSTTPDTAPLPDQPISDIADRQGLEENGVPVRSSSTGYLQAVDAKKLLTVAIEHDLVILLHHRPGHFVIQNQLVATFYPSPTNVDPKKLHSHVCECLILGQERTSEQDVEFAMLQLVEVAVRALSPGINDPHTAIRCVDWLAAALCQLSRRGLPSPYRRDESGRTRVIADPPSIADLIDAAFHQIRQASAGKPDLYIQLIDCMRVIAEQTDTVTILDALKRHADMVWRDAQRSVSESSDRSDVEQRHRKFLSAVGDRANR